MYRVVRLRGGKVTISFARKPDEELTEQANQLVVVKRFGEPIYPGLRFVGDIACGGDKPSNVVINGENFHALQLLTYIYEGAIDAIYIDTSTHRSPTEA